MKILVAVKRVLDYQMRVGPLVDGSGVDVAGLGMSMNPFDENAIEAAVRLKEAGLATEILAVTIGLPAAQDVLRQALAMGVDRALWVDSAETLQPLAIAKILRALVEREGAHLVLLGKQAIDDDAGQTGPMLAALLGWPQGLFASTLEVTPHLARLTSEIDGGTESLELDLPAVISADLRLNTPRFIRLSQRMQAKKKSIETLAASELNLELSPRLALLKIHTPPPRQPGIRLEKVAELAAAIRRSSGV